MKVVLINTYESGGGAAIACKRLLNALYKKEIEVDLLVAKKNAHNDFITGIAHNFFQKIMAWGRFVGERLAFLPYEKNKAVRFAFSPAKVGVDISKHELVREADIIHLHWTNFGFLSLKSLEKLFKLGKPIVWTFHDMWAFTGGCHYSQVCTNYERTCGNCLYVKNPNEDDLSHKIWIKKQEIYNKANFQVITCSKWLENLAKNSSLLQGKQIAAIPNPIDTNIFKPLGKEMMRKKLKFPAATFLLLFGAANLQDPRKGFAYLKEALVLFKQKYPSLNIELVLFGKIEEKAKEELPFKTHYLGNITSAAKMVEIYSIADWFVLPSLEDNLPNTVMEALACGVPTLAFKQGGIPEMIEHEKTGYLANYKSAESLAEGIFYAYSQKDNETLAHQAREKVLNEYNEDAVANTYIALYNSLLKTD